MSGTFFEIPIDVLTTPRDGEVYVDRWWMVAPGGALFWKGDGSRGFAPQCNTDRRAIELFIRSHGHGEQIEPLFIPAAYLGPWDEEWGFRCKWIEQVAS